MSANPRSAVFAAGPQSAVERAARPQGSRGGMTLVELLVVLAVVVALAAIGIPALMRARGAANDYAVQTNLSGLDSALNQFKTEFGFYPPDFTRIGNANQFLPFLNRVAPNHQESAQAIGFAPGVRRVDVWWEQVGKYLGPESALAFWLSGLAQNQQFPLTYVVTNGTPIATDDVVAALPPYEVIKLPLRAGANSEADLISVERRVFGSKYSTKWIQVVEGSDPRVPVPNGAVGYPIWDTAHPAVASLPYAVGLAQMDGENTTPVLYFELASYRPAVDAFPVRTIQIETGVGTAGPYADPTTGLLFNNTTFQLIAPGRDSFHFLGATANTNVLNIDKYERDNLTNFSNGPLESFLKK